MKRFMMAAAGGLCVTLALGSAATAQTEMDAMGTYPTPLPANNQGPGALVVAPGLRGAGATYSYVQQPGAPGMSPNAYYSQNFFTRTPMTSPTGYYPPNTVYRSGYSGVVGYTRVPATSYAAVPNSNSNYASANTTYYRTRRVGPLRRIFGAR